MNTANDSRPQVRRTILIGVPERTPEYNARQKRCFRAPPARSSRSKYACTLRQRRRKVAHQTFAKGPNRNREKESFLTTAVAHARLPPRRRSPTSGFEAGGRTTTGLQARRRSVRELYHDIPSAVLGPRGARLFTLSTPPRVTPRSIPPLVFLFLSIPASSPCTVLRAENED